MNPMYNVQRPRQSPTFTRLICGTTDHTDPSFPSPTRQYEVHGWATGVTVTSSHRPIVPSVQFCKVRSCRYCFVRDRELLPSRRSPLTLIVVQQHPTTCFSFFSLDSLCPLCLRLSQSANPPKCGHSVMTKPPVTHVFPSRPA